MPAGHCASAAERSWMAWIHKAHDPPSRGCPPHGWTAVPISHIWDGEGERGKINHGGTGPGMWEKKPGQSRDSPFLPVFHPVFLPAFLPPSLPSWFLLRPGWAEDNGGRGREKEAGKKAGRWFETPLVCELSVHHVWPPRAGMYSHIKGTFINLPQCLLDAATSRVPRCFTIWILKDGCVKCKGTFNFGGCAVCVLTPNVNRKKRSRWSGPGREMCCAWRGRPSHLIKLGATINRKRWPWGTFRLGVGGEGDVCNFLKPHGLCY